MIVKYVYFVTTCDDGDSNPVTFPMTDKEFNRMFNGGAFCEYRPDELSKGNSQRK